MLHSRPQQSWLQPVLQELSQSSFKQAAPLRRWLENVLPVLNPGRMETAWQELSAMHFEGAWAGSVLHDEFMEWQQEVYRGPTRSHFAAHVSERRDRGPGMDVKPRWATIMRPSRSMQHLVGRADSKLLSETRMGSVRSLSYRRGWIPSTRATALTLTGLYWVMPAPAVEGKTIRPLTCCSVG